MMKSNSTGPKGSGQKNRRGRNCRNRPGRCGDGRNKCGRHNRSGVLAPVDSALSPIRELLENPSAGQYLKLADSGIRLPATAPVKQTGTETQNGSVSTRHLTLEPEQAAPGADHTQT